MISNHSNPSSEETDEETSAEFVTVSRAELEALRTKAENAPVVDHPSASANEVTRESLLTKELAARDDRVAALERTCKAAVRDRELATMLAGRPLVGGAAAQLIKLWRDDFDVYEEDGAYKVAARDGRPPSQVINEWLSSSEYAHFSLPTSRGGTGARDTNKTSPSAPISEGPKNLGEAVVMKWREEASSRSNSLLKPIGLRRHK